MGYQTNYNLEIKDSDKTIQEILEEVFYNGECEDLEWAVDYDGSTQDAIKWYDHEDDMRKISLQYPNVVFKLKGEGEEVGDVWYKYFKNGKMQSCYAKISFDDYDESKLD